jgi:hypothetical protein
MTSERRLWTFRIGVAFGVWLVLTVGAYLLGNRPSPGLLALLVAVAAVTLWLFLDGSAPRAANWALTDTERLRPLGEDPRLAMLNRVVSQHLDAREVSDQLHRHLTELADHRLVAHHGVSRLADPERADRLMGPALAEYARSGATQRRLTAAQIAVLIDRIEAL